MPSSPAPKFVVEHVALTDLGMRRANNQDAVASPPPGQSVNGRGQLFVVADGMGAHAAGELASKLATDCIPHAYQKLGDSPPQAALRQAVQKANGLINAKGQSSPEFQGMGTTSSCLLLLSDAALVAHVGDSRVYRLRDSRLEQLTFDHSLVWEMAAASQTTADQVPACIPKNVITRSLGPHEKVNVDLEGPHALADGDVFLMCSDGLTGVVDDEVIGAVIGAMRPADAAQTLVDLANLRGGPDNVTVVVARVDGKTSASDSKPVEEAGVAPPRSPSAPRNSWSSVNRAAWLVAALCLLAVIWFASQRHGFGALVAAAGFGAAIVVALLRRETPETPAAPPSLGGPYGDGPYSSVDCASGDLAAKTLEEVVEKLADLEHRDVTETPGPPVDDWKPFHEERHKAVYAMETDDAPTAIAHYGAAIRTLMHQVRDSRTIDYNARDSLTD